jgi:hypothetical protein
MKTKSNLLNFILWFSNTEPEIYIHCPKSVQWKRIGYSLLVIITGIFAFITSSYLIRSMFQTYNENTKTLEVSDSVWIFSIIIGLIWSILIILIDKIIISSQRKYMAILRIPLAIMIGFVVSVPLEVQMFSNRINKALTEASRTENSTYQQKYDGVLNKANSEIDRLNTKIDNEQKEMSKWKDIMEAEVVGRVRTGRTGIAGQGSAWKEANENYLLHKSYMEQAQKELALVQQNYKLIKNEAKGEFQQNKINQSYDFLSQFEQLSILKDDERHKSLKRFANCIVLLFILIELIPALMKLLSETDEYDILLNAKSSLNEQFINANTNVRMEEIDKNKYNMGSGNNNQYQPKNSFPLIGESLN